MWRIVYYRLSVICASTGTDAHGISLDRMTDRSTLTAIARDQRRPLGRVSGVAAEDREGRRRQVPP